MPVHLYGLPVGVDPVLEELLANAADQMDKHTSVSQPARLAILRPRRPLADQLPELA